MKNIKFSFFFIICAMLACDQNQTGCTDPSATNYNPDAQEDDGTCVFEEDRFVGDYITFHNCEDSEQEYPDTLEMSITRIGETQNLILKGLNGNSDFEINATVVNDTLVFNEIVDGTEYVGSAYFEFPYALWLEYSKCYQNPAPCSTTIDCAGLMSKVL